MRWLLAPVLAALAVQAAGQPIQYKSEWELQQERERRDWQEGDVKFPAYPKADSLIEIFVSSASSFRFFVDPASLSLESDGALRYTLVARSSSGAQTVSFEGIRCGRPGFYRVYGFGSGGTWSKSTLTEWRPIEPKNVQRWHNELHNSYFCPQGASIHTAAEALDALRRRGHPATTR